MIYVRAIHFAATMMAAGVVFFVVFVAAPAFRRADTRVRAALWPRLAFIAWFSLVLADRFGCGVAGTDRGVDERRSPGGCVFRRCAVDRAVANRISVWPGRRDSFSACILAATFVPLLSAKRKQRLGSIP